MASAVYNSSEKKHHSFVPAFSYTVLEKGGLRLGLHGRVRIICENNADLKNLFRFVKSNELSELCVFDRDVEYGDNSLDTAVSFIARVKIEKYNEGKTADDIVAILNKMKKA